MQNAVCGDIRAAQAVCQNCVLGIHMKAVGKHKKDKFLQIGLRHIAVVGRAVIEVHTLKGLQQIHIC